MGWGGPTYVTCWSRQRPRPPLDDMPWCRGDARTQFRPSSCKKPRGHLKLVKRYLRDRRDCVRLSGRGGGARKHAKVCARLQVHACVWACLPACMWACMRKIVAGGPQHDWGWGWSNHMFSCDFHQHIPGRSHTLSAELRTAPPKDVTCSLQTHGCLASAYHNTAACRIMGGLNLKPRGAKQTLPSVAPSHWPYRKQSMIYYTVLQRASRSYHARLITG